MCRRGPARGDPQARRLARRAALSLFYAATPVIYPRMHDRARLSVLGGIGFGGYDRETTCWAVRLGVSFQLDASWRPIWEAPAGVGVGWAW